MLALPDNLPDDLKAALVKQGFSSLYSHQVEARNKIRQNKDVIITTPTSSGKTLCFNIPVRIIGNIAVYLTHIRHLKFCLQCQKRIQYCTYFR